MNQNILANESLVRLGWPIGQSSGILAYERSWKQNELSTQSEDDLANKRVLKVGWAIDQSEDILDNESVLRLGCSIGKVFNLFYSTVE